MTLVDVDKIVVGHRYRLDLGDLGPLVESIDEVGLLHPIVITDSFELVAGQRRLEAVRKLGHLQIEAHVLPLTPAEMLRGEYDENTVRMDFRPSEKVALGRVLEEEVARQKAENRTANLPSQAGTVSDWEKGETREIVGRAVGVSGPTYQRAKAVVVAAESDPEQFGDLVDKMDETRNVVGTFRELKAREILGPAKKAPAAKRIQQITALASVGHRAEQIADKLDIGVEHVRNLANAHGITLPDVQMRSQRIDPVRVVRETVDALEGLALGLSLISNDDIAQLDPLDREVWATSLNRSLRSLNRLRRQLKEEARGTE